MNKLLSTPTSTKRLDFYETNVLEAPGKCSFTQFQHYVELIFRGTKIIDKNLANANLAYKKHLQLITGITGWLKFFLYFSAVANKLIAFYWLSMKQPQKKSSEFFVVFSGCFFFYNAYLRPTTEKCKEFRNYLQSFIYLFFFFFLPDANIQNFVMRANYLVRNYKVTNITFVQSHNLVFHRFNL